ncbi:hypothetical protein [Rubritalea tangerina]|uniref:hypothetical protein n=1 Tax=Rubritalea tangerina TaxID=430798 RepID=UPI003613706B
MAENYFNTLPLRRKIAELGDCHFMEASEFARGTEAAQGKKIVIVGCGAQGLNQGLNMRDSGLDVSYALRDAAIARKASIFPQRFRERFRSWHIRRNASTADIVMNSRLISSTLP